MWGKPLRKKGGGYTVSALYAIIHIRDTPSFAAVQGGILYHISSMFGGRSVERLFLIGQCQGIKREEDIPPVIFNQ